MKCSMKAVDQHRSTLSPGMSCLSGRSQATRHGPGLGYGELEAPALSQALELSPSCWADPLSQGPFVAGAEPVPARHDLLPAQQHRGPRLWVPGAPAQLRAVLLAVPCEGKAWPHVADPARLIPLALS